MKASELRVGNWIHHEGVGDRCVDLITMRQICTLRDGEATNISPITLTTEWLEAFRFKKKMNHYEKGHALWISLEYLGDPTGTSIWIHGDYCPAVEIKFVHELQNLYFALTRKELELVPTPQRS